MQYHPLPPHPAAWPLLPPSPPVSPLGSGMLAFWVAPRSLPGLKAGDWMPLESRGTIWSVWQRNWSVMYVTSGKGVEPASFIKYLNVGLVAQAHLRVSTFIDLLVLVLITVKAVGELGLQGSARYLGVLESRLLLQLRYPPLQSPQRAQRLSSLKASAFQLQVTQIIPAVSRKPALCGGPTGGARGQCKGLHPGGPGLLSLLNHSYLERTPPFCRHQFPQL